jgi:hypothetical protein
VTADHWLGLERLHLLTSIPGNTSSLRIGAEIVTEINQGRLVKEEGDGEGEWHYEKMFCRSPTGNDTCRGYFHYGDVWVGDQESGYTMHVNKKAEDVSTLPVSIYHWSPLRTMYWLDGLKFSTADHDVDGLAKFYIDRGGAGGAGWWYGARWYANDGYININGIYGLLKQGGIGWYGDVILHYVAGYYATNPCMYVKRN